MCRINNNRWGDGVRAQARQWQAITYLLNWQNFCKRKMTQDIEKDKQINRQTNRRKVRQMKIKETYILLKLLRSTSG